MSTGGTQRLVIDNSGNVGVGAASPNQKLHLNASGSGGNKIKFTNDTTGVGASDGFTVGIDGSENAELRNDESTNMLFITSGSERLRIDSSGRLLVGLSTARQTGSGFTAFSQVEGGDTISSGSLTITSNRSIDDLGARLNFARSKGGSVGSNTVVDDNAELGGIYFWGADGTDTNSQGAEIIAEVDGTPGSNDMPTRLVFGTTADGGSSPTERMRINSSGRVSIGTSTVNTNSMLSVHRNTSDESQVRFTNTTTGEGGNNGFIVGIDISEHARLFNMENGPMRFGTNNTERMRIDSSGHVLVGKTTTALTTVGTRISSGLVDCSASSSSTNLGTNSGGAIRVANTNSTDNNFSNIGAYNSNGLVVNQINFINTSHSSRTGEIGFSTHNGSNLTERMRITSIGTVGIGVTSPAAGASNTPALDVDGPILASRPLAAHQTGKGVLQRSGNVIALRAYGETAGTGQLAFNTGGGGGSSDTERMRIDTNGRLLIGATASTHSDAQARLQVHPLVPQTL